MKLILSTMVGATLAFSAIETNAQATPGERQVSLTIESTSLATALDTWAQQSGFQIFVEDWEGAKRLTAPTLKGTFAAQAALEQLLKGTQLTYVWLNDRAVSIRKRVPPTVPAALQSSDDGQAPSSSVPVTRFSGEWGEQRLAANDQHRTPKSEAGQTDRLRKTAEGSVEELEEVVVTGTHIRGARTASPLTVVGRDYIESGGFTSVEQVIHSLSQAYGGGDAESTRALPGGSITNVGHGSSANLRGLGSGSTLVLVNGRRLAPAAFGQFVDISLIPLRAIDRIEVLADGASATYGSDAVAGVVNIVLREKYDGAETSLEAGSVTSGNLASFKASQTVGHSWERGDTLLTYEYLNRGNLDAQDRAYARNAGEVFDLLPKQESHSGLGTLNFEFSQSAKLHATALVSSRRSARNAFNSLIGSAQREDGKTQQYTGTLGADLALKGDWEGQLYGLYSKSQTQAEYSDGSIGYDNRLSTRSVESQVDGTLFSTPGGPAKLALGAGYREETYSPKRGGFTGGSRDISSVYAELSLPVIGVANARRGARSLEFSLAGRYEDYSDFGDTTNPKFGVLWAPSETLTLRGTYGTAFRAPLFYELDDFDFSTALVDFPDPNSASGATLALLINGNNSALKPEEATTWTAGLDWQPSALSGMKISFTYFDTHYKNRITALLPGFEVFGVFPQAEIYEPLIARDPDPARVDELIAAGLHFNLHGPFAPGDVLAIVDRRLQNLSTEDVRGLDTQLSYLLQQQNSSWRFQLTSTYYFEFTDFITDTAPGNDVLSTAYHQVDFKGRASATWTYNVLDVALAVNHVDGFSNRTLDPPVPVGSWTTLDFSISYTLPQILGGSEGARLSLSCLNALDRNPPRMTSPIAFFDVGFDPTNASPLGRFVSLSVTKAW
jgi:iron complex outermembrane recepter protein